MQFTMHSVQTAPEAAKPLLEDSKKKYGFVPNLHAAMAEAPALLEGYKLLSDLYAKTAMSVLERQIVLIAINRENECHYCMAAHSAIATKEKMPKEILDALRDGTPLADPKLQALRHFAELMTVKRGWVAEEEVNALLAAGYTKQTILEVILAVGYKVLSNYTNHIAETEVDAGFQPFLWQKTQAAAE